MHVRRIAWVLSALACATFVWGGPQPASADLIGSAPAPAPSSRDSDAPSDSARRAVAERLAAFDVGADEVDARLAQLSEADLQTLAAAPDQVQIAGEDSTLTVILAFVGVILLIGLLWIFLGRSDGDGDGGSGSPGAPTEEPFFDGKID